MWHQQDANSEEKTQATTLGDMLMMIAAQDEAKSAPASDEEQEHRLSYSKS